MGYESLSTVVVLAIVIILMAFWLPKRTVKGMKRVIEHREDRFSPSLHLVDADSGTRFSDETAAKAKGAIMQSNETHEGKLTDGTVFDSSFGRGAPEIFSPEGVVPGWTEALQRMKVGDEWILYVPPALGYGVQGGPPRIPPNAVLVFRLRLLDVAPTPGGTRGAPTAMG